jgi:putative transposase
MNKPLPNRQSIRLKNYDYSKPGYYFVTICVQNREYLFGEIKNGEMILNNAGMMIQQIWDILPNFHNHIKLDAFTIMPNHIHGIIHIVGADSISAHNFEKRAEMHSQKRAEMHSQKRAEMHSQKRAEMHSQKRAEMHSQKRAEMHSAPTVGTIVQSFKRYSTIKYIEMVKNGILSPFNKRIWQRNYWEHVVRNETELNQIRDYIRHNPQKWETDTLNGGSGNIVMEENASASPNDEV